MLLESLTKPCVPDRIKLPQLLVTGVTGVICEASSVNSVTSGVISSVNSFTTGVWILLLVCMTSN